jgi:hypothetical protein
MRVDIATPATCQWASNSTARLSIWHSAAKLSSPKIKEERAMQVEIEYCGM